jgi:hypothetical protein
MGWPTVQKQNEAKKARTKEELFKPAKDLVHKLGLKAGVHGLTGTGKTRICWSAKPPVYILGTEEGSAQLFGEFPGKDVRILECYVSTGDPQQDCLESLALMKEAVWALSDLNEGTVCIDSGTDLWEWIGGVLRLNVLKVDLAARVQPSDYKWANAEYRSIIMKCRSIPTHFIMTARDGEVFRDAKLSPTGVYKPQWQKWTPHFLDIQVLLYRWEDKGIVSYKSSIEKFRHHALDQTDFTNMDFDMLYEQVGKYLGVEKS